MYIIGLKCSFVKKMTIPVYSDPKCDGNCLSEIVCHTIFKLSASKDYDSIKDEKQGAKLLLKSIQTPEEVRVFAYDYLWIIYLGLPAAFLYNWGSAVLRAVVSQLFSAIVCLIYIKYRYPDLLFSRKDMEFDRRLLWKTVNFGFVSALYQSSLYIGKLLVQGAVNRAGTDIISAYTATMRVEGFANSFGDSGSASLSVFAAQNQGAGNERRVRQGFLKGLRMMVLLGIGLSGLMLLTTKSVIFLLMGEVSVKIAENADAYMRVISLFYVLCYVGSSFVGLYRGLGMIHIPVAGTILHISIRVILSYLLLGRMGLPAVALATGAGWTAFAVFQGSLYRKKIKKGEIPRCL